MPDYDAVHDRDNNANKLLPPDVSQQNTCPAPTKELEGLAEDQEEDVETRPFIKKTSISDYYTYVCYWGILRWLVSLVLLGGATASINSNLVPKVKPWSIFNLVSSIVHIVLVAPLLRNTHSTTNPRPSTTWLLQFILLLTLSLASVATSVVMMTITHEFKDERAGDGSVCRSKSGTHYLCFSKRSKAYEKSCVCLGGSAAVLAAMLIQLLCVCRVNKSRFTKQEIQAHHKYITNMQTATDSKAAWKSAWEAFTDIPHAFMRGWRQGRA